MNPGDWLDIARREAGASEDPGAKSSGLSAAYLLLHDWCLPIVRPAGRDPMGTAAYADYRQRLMVLLAATAARIGAEDGVGRERWGEICARIRVDEEKSAIARAGRVD